MSTSIRRTAVVTLTFALLLSVAPAALARSDSGSLHGGKAEAQAGNGLPKSEQTAVLNTEDVAEKPAFLFRKTPTCAVGQDTLSIAECTLLDAKCDEKPGGTMVDWDYKRNDGISDWETFQTQVCSYPSDPADRPVGPARPAFSITEFRSLPLKPAKIVTQPGRHTLKGAYTNVYAEIGDQGFSPRLAGKVISVRAHPSSFAWNYGDGTTKTFTIQGGPLRPDQAELDSETRTSHVYAGTGDYSISVTTTYTGEYSVDGGPWIPIIGTAQVNSPAVPMSVWRTETHLYAENCLENPNGEGCPSALSK